MIDTALFAAQILVTAYLCYWALKNDG